MRFFLRTITSLDDFILERDNTNIDNNEAENQKDKSGKNKPTSEVWIRSGESPYVKNKLIQILEGDVLISKQQQILCKILATLVYH